MNPVFFLAVGFGAFVGAVMRWLLGIALNPILPSLPLGTLASNLIGGLVMGVALGLFSHYETLPVAWRLAITTGFLGGLTTFSTFSSEVIANLMAGDYRWALAHLVMHLGGSLLLTALGIWTYRVLS